MKKFWISCLAGIGLMTAWQTGSAHDLSNGVWQAKLHRKDGADIVFNFEVKDKAGKKVLYVLNATDKLLVDEVRIAGDSLFIKMPFFDSEFKAAFVSAGEVTGEWIRHLADKDVSIPFSARANTPERFPVKAQPSGNVTGRWESRFSDATGKSSDNLIGEFKQTGHTVHGTFLSPTGDYRFLDGVVDGDTLKLSTFDGSHAYLFTALVKGDSITAGRFYAGIGDHVEDWVAAKNNAAKLPDERTLATVKPGQEQLDFTFPDMNGKKVSIKDARFKNKVVVITLMGSWCPNCMDETGFLSDWYKKNKNRGVEVIGLAYERTPDFEKSRQSLQGFLRRFNVQYPVLITGVTPGDPQKGEKTLPQLTGIKGFPTTIFIDKKGKVKEVHTGFSGPGTGEHYAQFQSDFNRLITTLLEEK
ncbi:TlpA disulfide reductase family protein [Chitinophaga nivalis]|uniref:TlpA family protein disulfide reductase n=1 Tax=Chitinophaga nivalis TaxID=2991709 RepID=A0ABT3IQ16_9BACT|nr:TlpA disulfide reductase family protein [Chitinophaga nivalis]MCW3464263.1 TlpA family protein disulfide reductase [Chitinophaga nivalis]MCW3486046.1 TlpA family protein disulfide reductase [Chitinophaga nivalis]